MASSDPDLSIAEWAVLGVLAEGRTHGFAIARDFAPDGEIGKVWTLPRPLVYRAIGELKTHGLVQSVGSAPGAAGPQRTLLEILPEGASAIDRWLETPIAHVRDARSHLIVKLLLLHRRNERANKLVSRQRKNLASMLTGLERQVADAHGFDRVLAQWRLSNARALDDFLKDLELAEPPSKAATHGAVKPARADSTT